MAGLNRACLVKFGLNIPTLKYLSASRLKLTLMWPKKKLTLVTEWGQYDPKQFFDVFKIKQSTTKLKIDIHKMIDLKFNMKKILAL